MRLEKNFDPSVMHRVGVSSYGYNEHDKKEKTPHYMMRKALETYESRPLVTSGVNQMVSFITGKGIYVEGEDQESIDLLEKWIDLRPRLDEQINLLTTLYLVCGNAYVEPSYKLNGDYIEIDNIFVFFDPSRVYYNFYDLSDEEYWLIEVDPNVRHIEFKGKEIHPRFRPWKTSPYSWFYKTNLWAAGIAKQNLFHLRQPYTRDGYYGFSFLQSTIDDAEAIYKIVRNMIAISNNKAIGRKLISVGDENDIVNEEDLATIANELEDSNQNNVLLNKKVQMEDLSYTGSYDTMVSELEFLRKDVSSGLIPNFISSWADEQNKASAEQARVPFVHTIKFHRSRIENFLNDLIVENLKEVYGLHPSTKIKFHEVDFYSINEKKEVYLDLYLNNAITLNQFREFMELEPVEGGDVFMNEWNKQFEDFEGEFEEPEAEPGAEPETEPETNL